jgi:hypothetical protein
MHRYSVLPALSYDGVLDTFVAEGSVKTDGYEAFVEHVISLMNPYPGHRSALVMDNASIHHSEELRDMCNEA